jgi:hypothetical protein
MTDLRCFVGLHDWQEYKSGYVNDLDLVIRSWCPRCKSDSIKFGLHREVYRNTWIDRTPQEAQVERDALMRDAEARLEQARKEYAEHMRSGR